MVLRERSSNFDKQQLLSFCIMAAIGIVVILSALAGMLASGVMSQSNVGVSSHVLDQTIGLPAANVSVSLFLFTETTQSFMLLGSQKTNSDGRIDSFLTPNQFVKGKYKAVFNVEPYFQSKGHQFFYPVVEIQFVVNDNSQHYHVPLLLSPFGYSTYRGS